VTDLANFCNGSVELLTYAVGPAFSAHPTPKTTVFGRAPFGGYTETPRCWQVRHRCGGSPRRIPNGGVCG
jgi:hypothetical protein